MSSRFRTAALTVGAIAVVGASLSAELVLYSVNTLERHPEWQDSKRLLAAFVMGRNRSPKTRNFVRRNRLNLHEWFGNNEMLIDAVVTPSRLEFGFLLGEDAHVSAIFDKTREGFSAVRLSRDPRRPSQFLRATPGGRFVSTQRLPDLELDAGWHVAELEFEEKEVALRLDGRPIARFEQPRAPRQLVGFRGGLRAVRIDDVRLTDVDGRVVLDETFRNRRGFATVWLVSLCIWLGVLAGPLAAAKALGRDVTPWLMRVLALGIVTTLLVGAVYAVDYFHFSRGYHYQGYVPWEAGELRRTGIEDARRQLFEALAPAPPSAREPSAAEQFLGRGRMLLKRGFEAIRTARGSESIHFFPKSEDEAANLARRLGVREGFRIVFLGSSQTWGAGAATRHDRLVHRVHRELVRALPASARLLTVNAAASGSGLVIQFAMLRAYLQPLEPQLVVANLANNDPTTSFEERLTELARYCRERGAQLIFVLEANDTAESDVELVGRHATMKRVAKRFGIPTAGLHEFIASPEIYDSGYLWWDIVHMTSYGQRVAADFLSDAILRHFDFTADGQIVPARGDRGALPSARNEVGR